MSKDAKPTDDGLTQSERFMQAARELECDDDPKRFAERVKRVARNVSDDTVKLRANADKKRSGARSDIPQK